jgi:hypothetical protein
MNQFANRVVLRNLEESVVAALEKLAPEANIPIAGQVAASKDLRAKLSSHVSAMDASSDARAKLVQAVTADREQRAQIRPLLAAIRSYAAGVYGEGSPEFALFGFKPKKVGYRTAETKAQAVEKLRATRAARHTMGKRQRSGIHGTAASPGGGTSATPSNGGASPRAPGGTNQGPPNGSAPSSPVVTPPANGAGS